MKAFLHSGDRGDLFYSLPVIRDNGPGKLYVADKPWTRPITPWIDSARLLLESQSYISSLEVHASQPIDHDFSTFRGIGHYRGRTICELHFIWVRLRCDQNMPWLTVEPDSRSSGRIVIGRTPRYNNPHFPWKGIVETFGNDLMFIGLPEEHQAFCQQFGEVEYCPTDNLLEVASLIEGSDIYIGNQSCPYAICEGLKHRSIQETHLQIWDCIYPRTNALYCFDGALKFEACGKTFESHAPEYRPKIPLSQTPPGGWECQLEGFHVKSHALDASVKMMREKLRSSGKPIPENLQDIIVEQCRHKFPLPPENAGFVAVRQAVRRKYQHLGLPSPC